MINSVSGVRPSRRLVYMEETDSEKNVILAENGQSRHLTSGPDWHLYPDISENGDKVTLVSGPDADHLGVSVIDIATGQERLVSDRDGRDLHPTFSGDGKKIAFSDQTGPESRQITIVDAPTFRARFEPPDEKPRQVAVPGSEGGYFPALSEDGSRVVYQRANEGKREIVSYDFSTQKEQVLAEGMSPSLSMDDQWLTYTRKVDGEWNIHLQNLESGESRQVTRTPHFDFAPSFDGEGGIYFASNRAGTFDIYHLSAENIAKGSDQSTLIAQSPDTLYAPESDFPEKSL